MKKNLFRAIAILMVFACVSTSVFAGAMAYYSITKEATQNGSFVTSTATAAAGTQITITPTADDYYGVDTVSVTKNGDASVSVEVTDNHDGTYGFTMPSYPVKVTVTFAVPTTGYCGDPSVNGGKNVIWTVTDTDSDGTYDTLAISGTGAMVDLSYTDPHPWELFREGIEHVDFGSGITSIGACAFGNENPVSPNLTSVSIADSVKSIGSYAFAYCENLTSITIPNNVDTIGYSAFRGCSGLTSVTIPSGVETIGDSAFSECTNLTTVTISDGVKNIGGYAFFSCSSLGSVTLPDSVKTIGENAFIFCSSLTSITLSNTLTSIGEMAFGKCSQLESITIPDTVTSIGLCAFWYCSSLASVEFKGTVGTNGSGIEDMIFDLVGQEQDEVLCEWVPKDTLPTISFPATWTDNMPDPSTGAYYGGYFHTHSWSYAKGADDKSFVATCQHAGCSIETLTLGVGVTVR